MLRYAVAHVSAPRGWLGLCRFIPMLLIGGILTFGLLTLPAGAQLPGEVPSLAYDAAFSAFYDGDYQDALEEFRAEGRGAIKTPQARWIDSICYETMAGECYFQMGLLSQAFEHYTAAVQLYVAYSEWMRRVQFPPAIRPAAGARRIPWGSSSRRSRRGRYSRSMPILLGQIDHNAEVRRGGVVQQAHLRPLRVQEIVRCTTLAIRRRAKLMGPAARHDALFAQLIARLSRRPGLPNHWSEAWIDVQLGLALAAGGKEDQALPHLLRGVVAAGEFDHPMTSIALLELGRLAMAGGNCPAASKYFEEATYAAVHYPNLGVLEEAFRGAASAHLLANHRGIYSPLAPAAEWAKRNRFRQLQTSLLLLQAENYALLGQTPKAAALLDAAAGAIGRRQMGAGRIGCRLNFLRALVLFQQKKIADGNAALDAAMSYLQHGSYWLFHITLADGLYAGGTVKARTAMELYDHVLRDPLPADWVSDPMESLSVLVTPHPGPLERWFHVALEERNEHEKALEIADRARRHRFFSSLAFGGRLQSLRWILEGPTAALDQQSRLLRQDLLTRYPAYDQLAQQAQALRTRLKAMPLVAGDQSLFRQQAGQLSKLAALSTQQEALLREMAVRREPAGLVFPPLRNTKDIQKSLPPGHALLVFFATSRHLYGFLLNDQDYTHWKVGAPAMLSNRLAGLLREMGQFSRNHELSPKDLADEAWKQSARQVLDLVLEGSRADFTQKFDELVIVPDGLLWYLPFEALQVNVDGRLHPLIERFRIRYAPTVSLAVATGRDRKAAGNTAVVVGRLFPRDDDSVAQAAFDRLAQVVPGAVALTSPPPAPSAVYGSLFDRLIVLDDINLAASGPYGWSPVPTDGTGAGSRSRGNLLSDWLLLPWQGPDEVILPGYHTAAENALKGFNEVGRAGKSIKGFSQTGSEVFLSVCGLMSSGAQTLLLSRWRTGGQTSFDLAREFAQELPHTSPADAWQRAVFLTADSRIDLDAEPRIKRMAAEQAPKASHPFFWAGYILIDSGVMPQQPDAPMLKGKKHPEQLDMKRKAPNVPM